MADAESLQTKYRPENWDEVIGQDKIVDALSAAVVRGKERVFLFTGPSGCGKTTLAMLCAKHLKCEDIQDTDAATDTGVDDMRAITAGLLYRPLAGGNKAIIIDEAHMLSKNAWTSLLKSLEKPAPWVYWFFCTTDGVKVPVAARNRAVAFELKPVSSRELTTLLGDIARLEDLKIPGDVIVVCAREAQGSPRQAISNLAACLAAKTKEDAAELLHSAAESAEAIDLARALYRGAKWPELQQIVAKMKGLNPEGVRQVVRAYGTTIVLSAPKESVAGPALEVLDAFSVPFNSYDGVTPLLLACAKLRLQ